MENNAMALTELTPKRKSEPMIRPSGGGIVEKAVVVGGGLAVVYTFAATLPIASVAALVGIAAYCWDEVGKFRSRETSDQLEAILNASTPKHPSINEVRAELKRLYPVAAINRAIESMVGAVDTVYFKASDKHPLAPFGEVVCWINPEDKTDVKLPLERLEELLTAWGLVPTVETTATPHQGEELASPNPAPTMATTMAASYPGREDLITRLKAECPELLRLVKAPPIRLVGLQKTGKSTFAQRLTLLRMVLLPGHSAAWATPHREADNPVPAILNPTGYTSTGAKDYPSIEALWVNTQDRIDQGETVNLTAVWDEFGGYDQFQDQELLKGSLRSLLREASKHQYYPILIAHGDQASFYPGVANILTTVRNSTVKVETIGAVADDFGTMAPTGKATITWLDGSISEVTWPAWLTADYLLAILQAPPAPPAMAPVADNSAVDTDAYGAAESPAGEPATEDDNARRVAAKLAVKLEDAKGEWITIRDLTVNLFRQPQDRELATQMIRDLINEYRLESIDKMNPNKTVSVFVRLKPADPPANNSLN
jgi:hypothetical protein